jgi:AcrR family transcriptional regulator
MRTRDEAKEQAIRQKAIEMIAREGLDGFGVNKLAKAVGVSPATIYIYYQDREDLILRLAEEVTERMLEFSLKDFDPEMDFAEGLRIQWINRAAYFTQYPAEVQFTEYLRHSHYHDKLSPELLKKFKEKMGKFTSNAVKRKQLLPLPFEIYWSVAFAPLYQLIKFHTQGRSMVHENFTLDQETLMRTLQLVLKALKPGPA